MVKGLLVGVVLAEKEADKEITNTIRKMIKPVKNYIDPNCSGRNKE